MLLIQESISRLQVKVAVVGKCIAPVESKVDVVVNGTAMESMIFATVEVIKLDIAGKMD